MASEDTTQGQNFVECSICREPVLFFCRQCKVNLCGSCVAVHVRARARNGHTILDFASKDDNDPCLCEFHPEKECSFYCITCDVAICLVCVPIKHRSHDISELADKIKELLKEIAKENNRLQSSKHELEINLDRTVELLSSLSEFYKERKDEVSARGDELHREINQTVEKLHRELDDMQTEHETLLEKQKKEFEEMIEKINEMNQNVTKLQKSHDVKKMQTFIPGIQKHETPSEFPQYSFPKFHVGKIDLQTYFGYVEKLQQEAKVSAVISVIDTGFPASDEYQSRLYDMAVTDDNRVWMGGNDRKLKLFDMQGNIHKSVSISWKGMYICVHNKQVVYSDKPDKAVKMISVTGDVITLFKTGDWYPRGVTSTSANDILVCLSKDDQFKVVRYSSNGIVLQEIQYDLQRQPLYTDATYVTENINDDIIVTDLTKKAVIAVDRQGIHKYTYSGNNGNFFPCSITNDKSGNVIITDYRGEKIHFLDRDGKFLKCIVTKESLNGPRAVCVVCHGEMMVGEKTTGLAKRIKYDVQ